MLTSNMVVETLMLHMANGRKMQRYKQERFGLMFHEKEPM